MPANFERVHALVESGRAVGKIVLSGFRASTRRCNCLRGVAVGVGGELYRIGRPQAHLLQFATQSGRNLLIPHKAAPPAAKS
jgi:hypothetical protein